MKKRIFAVLMTLLCVSLVFALASCGDTPDEPTECTEHTFGEWETETYASCTQDGLRIRECTVCGFEEEEEIVGEHKWGDWQTVTELTCTQHGLKTRTCSVCEFEERDEKEAQGHAWGTEPSNVIQEGDCTTDGIYEYKCDNCEETKEETVEAVGHDWSEWGKDLVGDPFVKEATCQEAGYIGRECIECGEPEYEYTDKLPHEWEDWVVVGTCADGATRTRGCVNCDAEEEETSAPGEHANVVYEGAKAPTLEEDGSTGVKKCLACNTTLEDAKTLRIINAALDATVTTTSAHWHVTAKDGVSGLKALVDGDKSKGQASDPGAHYVYVDIELAKAQFDLSQVILTVNGSGYIPAIWESPSNTNQDYRIWIIIYDENDEEIFKSQEYNTLDKTEIVIDVELPKGATARKVKVVRSSDTSNNYLWEVEIYGTKYITACDITGSHSWGDWVKVNAPVCNEDGTLTNGLETRTCSVCGDVEEKVIEATHSFGAWDETGVNCETGGTRTKTCSACGYVVSETVAAGEHVETEIQGAKEPTFEEDGYTGDKVCTVCGETTEEGKAIPKLVNHASTATPTADGWTITPSHINDGDMNTGVTGYISNPDKTIHTLTWSSAVNVDVIKLYFNGETTGKKLGSNIDGFTPERYNVTNADATLTVKIYGADGTTVIKTEDIATKDLTEYTISFEATTQISKIEIANVHSWDPNKCVNIWEVQVIAKGTAAE
ncbi:MAG: hypothetical protein J6C61_04480 [Clostridia bacterium]|nr:hypothetical protein [Clostridia bacterium]